MKYKVTALLKDNTTREQIVNTEEDADALRREWYSRGDALAVDSAPVSEEQAFIDKQLAQAKAAGLTPPVPVFGAPKES